MIDLSVRKLVVMTASSISGVSKEVWKKTKRLAEVRNKFERILIQ